MKNHGRLQVAVVVIFIASLVTAANVSFPLEWNVRRATDVPFEAEIQYAKLGLSTAAKYTVFADGKALDTMLLEGKVIGSVDLRFTVPAGTRELVCTAEEAGGKTVDAEGVDNLFAGWRNAKWSLPAEVKATGGADGILFESADDGLKTVSLTVDVPEKLRGRQVKLECDVTSRAQLTWGGRIIVVQLDAAGRELPDAVSDPRWTTHMRPPARLSAYREDGAIHVRAAKLRIDIDLRGLGGLEVDNYGLPLTDRKMRLPSLHLSHLALRPAVQLPFPKFADRHFSPGVSGEKGDCAFNSDGFHSIWFQTHSHGVYAQAKQLRDERECFFPSAAGTAEAWFKFDRLEGHVYLFTLVNRYSVHGFGKGGECNSLYYDAKAGKLVWNLLGADDKKFTGRGKAQLKCGEWTHVACQWQPGGTGEVFVNGVKAMSVDLAAYTRADISDPKLKLANEMRGGEFYLGCPGAARHRNGTGATPGCVQGAIDLFRASTGKRYQGDFTPAKNFALDDATRALFAFDREFEGIAAGGTAKILACTRMSEDRTDHRLALAGGRTIQYFPAELPDSANPNKVLDVQNYKDVPTAAEYRQARRETRRSFDVKTGDTVKFTVPAGAYPDFTEIANTGSETLDYPAAIGLGDLDVRSFGDLTDCVNVKGATDLEKCNRVFQMVISASDYFMNHNADFEYGSDSADMVCYKAMTVINSYCGFECGPLNNMTANMFATVAGCPAAQTGGYGHSFEEVFFDGRNHIYDLSAQKFFPSMDFETSASLRETGDQPFGHNLVDYSVDHFIRRNTRGFGAQNPDYRAKVGLKLRPGERFRVWYGNNGEQNNLQVKGSYEQTHDGISDYDTPIKAPKYFAETGATVRERNPVRRIDRFFPDYSSGFIVFEGAPSAANPAFTRVERDSFCYDVKCGYVITAAKYQALTKDGRPAKLEISTDLKDFRPLPQGEDGAAELDYLVRARHGYLIRVNASIADVAKFYASTEVQVNRRTYPGQVKRGENELFFKSVNPGSARLTVQWRENAKEIAIAGDAFNGCVPGFERQIVFLNDNASRTLAVKGASAAAKVVARGPFEAKLADGRLTVRATGKAAECGEVTVEDGDASIALALVYCPGGRFASAANAKPIGGAKAVAADADRVQAAAWLEKDGDGLEFRFPELPAGKYVVMELTRWGGGLTKVENGQSVLVTRYPGKVPKVYRASVPSPEGWLVTATPNKGNCDFLKAPSGRRGGRGRWKWDYPCYVSNHTPSASWSGWTMLEIDYPAISSLEYRLRGNCRHGVELAAAMVLPAATATEDFRAQLKKLLIGYTTQPWRVTP